MAPRAFLALVALSCLLVTGAEAGPPTDTLRATFAQANRIITDPAMEARPLDRLVAIRALFSKVFDFRGAAEHVLGPEWKARTAVEFRRPTKAFEDAVAGGGLGLRMLTFGAMCAEGGVPIVLDGRIVGAIGVSGAASHQDAQVAQAGADAVG